MKQGLFGGVVLVIALGLMTILGGSWFTVDAGHRGVITRNGRVVGIADPGFGWKAPWIDAVAKFPIGIKTLTWGKIQVYSRDQQTADLRVSVQYSILPDQVMCLYTNQLRDEDAVVNAIVAPKVQNNVKNVFGTYDAATAINSGAKLTADINKAIEDAVKDVQPCGHPVVQVDAFNLENVDFSDAYEKSVEERMIAQIQVAKAQQNADRAKAEADQAYNEADGRARSVEREAAAEAKAIQMKGDAAAEVISARGKALHDNPQIPQLVIAEKWDGRLPTSMIPGSTVPLMSIAAPTNEQPK